MRPPIDLSKPATLRITCAPTLGPFLRQEVEALGYPVVLQDETGVEVRGTLEDAMRLNLRLRTAYQVLLLLKEYRCQSTDELYRCATSYPWEDLVPPDGYLSIVSRVDTSCVRDWNYATLKLKDAIVDRMQRKTGRRPDSGPERDRLVVQLYWKDTVCRLYLSTSGQKLADRGYRRIPLGAPMRETLAAAVLLAARYDPALPLINPMCGSGTLAIEAALLALGRAPGLLRSNFGFLHLRGFDPEPWQQMRREAQKSNAKTLEAPIVASDIDPAAVDAARKNAATAGVDRLIDFRVCDFADTPLPGAGGMVLLNPEYGERMGAETRLEGVYKAIGDFFKKKCAGRRGFVFTGNLELGKRVGLKPSRRIPFVNGEIECRLFEYSLYAGTKFPAQGEAGKPADGTATADAAEDAGNGQA